MLRLEGLAKLTGRERYLDDEPIEGCLWGMTVRSPVARGRITGLRFDPSINWPEFVVVDHRDIPGANETYLIEKDQPVLAWAETRHIHEAVALIAHPDRAAVRRAVAGVRVEADPLPASLDFREVPRPEQVQRGSDNTLKSLKIEKGDVHGAFRGAHRVIEGVYESGAQEHVYIENQAMAAWLEGDMVVVRAELVGQHYIDGFGDEDPVSIQPGVDITVPLSGVDLIVRPTGLVGVNDSPNWGLGLSIALAQSAS